VPFYDYKCVDCGHRFEQFISYQDYEKSKVACPACHQMRVIRRISRVRMNKSEESRMSDLANPESLEGIDDDPQRLGRMMRKMSSEMGEDMGPEFNEVVGRLEKGEAPEQIEKELPDLGGSGIPGPLSADDLGDDF
jgi:putative FmdB family regulatory protein